MDTPISIHTLRMEGDLAALRAEEEKPEFQSTPSAWRVTGLYLYEDIRIEISIHTLRMEGDAPEGAGSGTTPPISIHTLRMEGDQVLEPAAVALAQFQSTPSAWRVTP